ncbi:MAG: hypothetical protein Q9217_001098 [Psora testacea]
MISQHQLFWTFLLALSWTILNELSEITALSSLHRAMIFLPAFLLLFLSASSYNILVYPRISPLRHLPTAPQQALWKRLFKEPTPWLFEKWSIEVPNDGLIRYFGIFNQERLLLTSSEGVHDVLCRNPYHFEKQKAQKIHLEPVLGRGLVFVEGETHKFHRKQMAPAFAAKCIRDVQPLFWKKTTELLDLLSAQLRYQPTQMSNSLESDRRILTDGFRPCQVTELKSKPDATVPYIDFKPPHQENTSNPATVNAVSYRPSTATLPHYSQQPSGLVEVHDPVSRTALDIIGLAACNYNFDSLNKDEKDNQMVRNYRKVFGVSFSNKIRCLLALVFPPWIVNNVPIKRNRDIGIVVRLIERLARSIIAEKRSSKESSKEDFVGKAMQGGRFTDDTLVEQVKTLLAAGHDTTSSTLASATAVLSQPKHHHIQERLRVEIRENLASPMGYQTLACSRDVESLKYLTAVRNEILRLYPPFSWYFRLSVVPTIICGYQIPKDMNIIFCPWALHRSKSLWGPDAEEFNPDRWLNDPSGRGGAKDAFCFSTFGAGPRVCIAERFAKNEISTLMAGIFGRFDLRAVEGGNATPPLSHQLTLTHLGGVRVHATLLDGW